MNYRIIYSDELYHHGVKGMKWGVRRTPEQLGHRRSKSDSLDSRYVYRTASKIYRLEGNNSDRARKKSARMEEELESYLSTKSSHSNEYRRVLDKAASKHRKVTKLENKSERYGHKETLAKTTKGKNKMGDKRIDYEYKAKQKRALNDATSRKEKWRQKKGAEQISREYESDAAKARMRSDRAMNERTRKKYDNEAFNAQSKSDYFKKMSESNSTLDRIKFAAKNYYKVPLKDTHGRETTVGKEAVKKAATQIALDLIMPTPSVKSAGSDMFYVKDGTRVKAALAIPNAREQRLNAEAASRTAKKAAGDNRYSKMKDDTSYQKQLFDNMSAARASGNKEQQKYYEELLRYSLRNTARG